jgi:outer membrane protein assembly factor BamB
MKMSIPRPKLTLVFLAYMMPCLLFLPGYLWGEFSHRDAVRATLEGYVTDAVTGQPIAGVMVIVGEQSASTEQNGFYQILDVPAASLQANFYSDVTSGNMPLTVRFTDTSTDSAHELTATKTGYSTYINNRVAVAPDGTTRFDFAMNPTLLIEQLRFVLNWGEHPSDLDLHLQTPEIEGQTYHVYFADRGLSTDLPYAMLDQDVTTGFGPETITIHQLFSGLYYIYVYQYSAEGTLAASDASIQIYNDQGLLHSLNIPRTGDGRYWNVATVDGENGRIAIINQIQDTNPAVQLATVRTKVPARTSDTGIANWSWTFGDGNTSSLQHPVHTYQQSGVYTVSLKVTNDVGIQHTRTRTDYITVSGVHPGSLKWSLQLATGEDPPFVRSSPALSHDEGTLYIGANNGNVYAVNAETGLVNWEFNTGGPVRSSPTVAGDGTVYVGSNNGTLYALDPENGSKKWEIATGGAIWSSPAVGEDGSIFVSSNDGKLYARTALGIEKWTTELGGGFLSSPVIGVGGMVHLGSEEGLFFAVSPDNGNVIWEFNAGWTVYGAAAIGPDGTVYATSNDGQVFALDSTNGGQKWSRNLGTSLYSSPALGEDRLYFGGRNGIFYALALADGAELWTKSTEGPILSSPTLGSDNVIYFGGYDRKVHAVDTEGNSVWSHETGGEVFSSPVVAQDGVVYVGSHDGSLYALRSSSQGTAATSWPRLQNNNQNTGLRINAKRVNIVPFLLPLLLDD